MNKKHWMTIPLDEPVKDIDIQEMVQVSYSLIAK